MATRPMKPAAIDRKVSKRARCPACGGSGVLMPALPSCDIPALRRPWFVVERCDTCERFSDDLAAASTRYTIAGWFRCANGGEHALVDGRSRRRAAPHN
jgi:hypothetical protein